MSDHVASGHQASVFQRMDRLPVTGLHIAIVAVAAAGFMFDLLEMALGNALSAVFSAPPHSMKPSELSVLLSSVYVGAIIGAPLLGWLSDRWGRRYVLSLLLFFLAAMSVLAAGSPDVFWLTVFRGLSGLALGAYPPLMGAYLADTLPPKHRGMLIFVVCALAAIGPVCMIFMIRWLTPLQPLGIEAWRWAVGFGGVGAFCTAIAYCFLPESPRWLETHGRTDEAEKITSHFEQAAGSTHATSKVRIEPVAGANDKASSGSFKRNLLILLALNFLAPWAPTGFAVLSGAVLVEKGFQLSDTLLYVGVATFGPVIGTVLAGTVIDKVERRTALMSFSMAMIVIGAAFAYSFSPMWLMITGIAFNIFGALYIPTLTVYAAEVFPARIRATAMSWAWGFNRIGSALVPMALLPLLHGYGTMAMFSAMTVALGAGIVLLFLFAPKGSASRGVD